MRLLGWSLYALYLITLTIACFIPDLIEMGFHTDKMMHVTFVSIALIWPCFAFQKWRYVMILCGLILLGGVCVEFLQGLTPDRKPEWEDIAANIVGVFSGLLMGYLLRSGYETE